MNHTLSSLTFKTPTRGMSSPDHSALVAALVAGAAFIRRTRRTRANEGLLGWAHEHSPQLSSGPSAAGEAMPISQSSSGGELHAHFPRCSLRAQRLISSDDSDAPRSLNELVSPAPSASLQQYLQYLHERSLSTCLVLQLSGQPPEDWLKKGRALSASRACVPSPRDYRSRRRSREPSAGAQAAALQRCSWAQSRASSPGCPLRFTLPEIDCTLYLPSCRLRVRLLTCLHRQEQAAQTHSQISPHTC